MDDLRIQGFTSSEQRLVTQEVSAEAGRCLILLGILGVWYQIDIGQILDMYWVDIGEMYWVDFREIFHKYEIDIGYV